MGRESRANGKRCVENEDKALAKEKAGVKPGDVTWLKFRGSSWWPAQVVDEKAISSSVKPGKGKSGEVLVRLYGTYKYSYVDPLTSNLEFHNVLKRHNGSYGEIIQKALKQYGSSKAQSSKDKDVNARQTKRENGNVVKQKAGSAKRAHEKQDGENKEIIPDSLNSDVTLQISGRSARRLKVMQGLGLTAPSGSPFLKNGEILSIMQ